MTPQQLAYTNAMRKRPPQQGQQCGNVLRNSSLMPGQIRRVVFSELLQRTPRGVTPEREHIPTSVRGGDGGSATPESGVSWEGMELWDDKKKRSA